jgi:hypothetical protein
MSTLSVYPLPPSRTIDLRLRKVEAAADLGGFERAALGSLDQRFGRASKLLGPPRRGAGFVCFRNFALALLRAQLGANDL